MTVMAWDPEKESSKWYKNPFKHKSPSDAYVQLQKECKMTADLSVLPK